MLLEILPELPLSPLVPDKGAVIGTGVVVEWCRHVWIAALILVSTLERTACIEEATAVCMDCAPMDESAAIPAEWEVGGLEVDCFVVTGGSVAVVTGGSVDSVAII